MVIPSSDFYHSTAAFTWNLNVGVLMPVSSSVDVTAQVGLRHVGGLSQVDQFAGCRKRSRLNGARSSDGLPLSAN